MTSNEIISFLPYQEPFLFVDGITQVSKKGISGFYTFKKESFFYEGHFKNHPVTPGVILTECMAQIGLVCLGITLFEDEIKQGSRPKIALTSSAIDFFIPVYPEEKVVVMSEMERFRFHKLKCNVKLYNAKNELVCRGKISGMITT